MDSLQNIIVVCMLTGLAGFIDSIAGGGGLISLPAYLLTGLPAQIAAGSNKFSACMGSMAAIARFAKSGKIQWRDSLAGMLGALAGSAIGTQIAILLSEHALRLTFIIALPSVAIFLVCKGIPKADGAQQPPCPPCRAVIISLAIGLVLGAYDGLVGPGAGTFMILAFIAFMHSDMVTASANAKVINNASGIASTLLFLIHGDVCFMLAIPASVATITGNILGVRYCLKHGPKGVKKVLFIVLALLFAKLLLDIILK